jgi:predicted metal-binding transcription factor (methanogenesis marker protein 9)
MRRLTIFLLILACLTAMGLTRFEISTEEYFQLKQALMELSIQEWQERVEAANQNEDDRRKLTERLDEITDRNRALRDEIYRRHGMSAREDLRYASTHAKEFESYLEENPEVKNSIESLKERLNSLVQQFEAAVKPAEKGAEK